MCGKQCTSVSQPKDSDVVKVSWEDERPVALYNVLVKAAENKLPVVISSFHYDIVVNQGDIDCAVFELNCNHADFDVSRARLLRVIEKKKAADRLRAEHKFKSLLDTLTEDQVKHICAYVNDLNA